MNQKGFLPPYWFIVGIILLFLGLLVGGIDILLKTGFFYLMGSVVALILGFLSGQANKISSAAFKRKGRKR